MTIGLESNCSLLTDPHNQEKISDDDVESDDDEDVDNERTTALETPIEDGTLVQG